MHYNWPIRVSVYIDYKNKPYNGKLGYLKDSNAGAHYVDSDIFYTVIRQPARSKTYIKLYFLK